MKKYTILLIGLSVMALGGLQLPLTGCKMPQWQYVGNIPPKNAPDVAADLAYGYRLIQIGETFPDTALKTPESPQDRSYLGLASDDAVFSIKDIFADLVLVEIVNVHCVNCQIQAAVYNDLFQDIETDPAMKGRIKMIAVGAGNTETEIRAFREKYAVQFPIVADQQFELHEAVGKPATPFSILVRLKKNPDTAVVGLTALGVNKDYEGLYQDMMALMTLDTAVLREKGSQTSASRITVEPPQSESEITTRIKDAMSRIIGLQGDFTEFRKLALEGHHVYTGIKEGTKGTKRLFAEVISRPTICDVCHDVHFFYIFNEKGAVVEFVPLQVTKWGNEEWTREDVDIMRQRLVGRFIFTPFYFNPQLDAVTSATITSDVLFSRRFILIPSWMR